MHLIQKHTFDIQCTSQEFGKEIQQQLSMLLEKDFYPQLDILFNKYDISNHTWSIDILNLELPKISKKDWKTELIQKSLSQIEDYLKIGSFSYHEKQGNSEAVPNLFISKSNHAEYLFLHFLKTGIIPENTISKDLEKIVLTIIINEDFIQKLIAIFESDNRILMRWIFSVPVSFKKGITIKIDGFSVDLKRTLNTFLENYKSERINPGIKKLQKNSLLKSQWIEFVIWVYYLLENDILQEAIAKDFIQLSNEYWEISLQDLNVFFQFILNADRENSALVTNNTKRFIQTLITKSPIDFNTKNTNLDLQISDEKSHLDLNKNEVIAETAHYINNAGLVILHPFLKPLFVQLKLCEIDGTWKNRISQHKAILLTEYVVTGNERIRENELILNKVFCGFPLDSVVNVTLKITKTEKEKCRSLLEAVLEHWKPMNSSSIEALQQTFLQRDAKLELTPNNEYELWVEEKGVDILLDQLPWGIGMIQTPWMENYLQCYWN